MLHIAMLLTLGLACGDKDDTGTTGDGGATDGGSEADGGTTDGGTTDGGTTDGGSDYETPLDWDPSGKMYLVDLDEADFVSPPSLGESLSGAMNQPMMLEVLSADTTLDLRLGWANDTAAHQDQCFVTVDTLATWLGEAPVLSSEREDIVVPANGGYGIPFTRTFVTATFGAEDEPLSDVVFEGQWDMRQWAGTPFAADVIGASDADGLCAKLGDYSVSCTTCDTDGKSYCVDVQAELKTARPSALSQVEVTAKDVAADERCD